MSYIDDVHYRLYRPDDFPALYAIEEACFLPPVRFPRDYMQELVTAPQSVTWIAEEDEHLAGFAIMEWFVESTGAFAYIQTIEVLPEFRRRGIAVGLLKQVERSARKADAKQIWLHVDEKNMSAIQLYCIQGFQLKGREANYYGRNRAAAIYCKSVTA